VLLDALIVRSVLVPALMILIGDANWKLPHWLGSTLPRVNVEGRGGPRAEGHGLPEPEPAAG
jgi:RND superfamily putative drug exporter